MRGLSRVKGNLPARFLGEGATVTPLPYPTKSGRYFASVQVETEYPRGKAEKPEAVGVDMGLKDFVVTSDAVKISAPKYLQQAQKKLARLQRRLSRREIGSKGRDKARLAVARQHEKIANQRSDFLHKTSRRLVDHYGLIGIEDLNVRGMVKNHKLAKAISDVGWGEFKRQLLYKGQWYGARVVVIDRFYPSSRECSACHSVLPELKLSVREWDCPVCGAHHDRDLNAAVNILNQARSRAGTAQSNADGEGVSPAVTSWLSAAKSEAARSSA